MKPSELRHRAAIHYLHFTRSLRKVASIYGVGKSSVARWASRLDPTAAACASRHGRRPTLVQRVAPLVAERLAADPFLTVDRILADLRASGEKIGRTTVGSAIRRANFSRKRTRPRFSPREATPADAAAFLESSRGAAEVISVDETSVYVDDTPRYGYTPKGQRCVHRRRCPQRTGRVTLVMAVSPSRGVVHHRVVRGSLNSEGFAVFVSGIRAPPGSAMLLDNAAIHRTAAVRSAAAAAGLRPVFCPPYSPEFNPIEGCFSVLKQALRSGRASDLGAALPTVTPAKVAAFFGHSFRHAERLKGDA